MDLKSARHLAHYLMDLYHVGPTAGWTFRYDRAARRFGQCNSTTKEITLSPTLTLLNNESEVRNTILHEIAHAIVGCRFGHGPIWQKQMISMGLKPERCYNLNKVKVVSRYNLICPKCYKQYHINRITTSVRRGNRTYICRYDAAPLQIRNNPDYAKQQLKIKLQKQGMSAAEADKIANREWDF